MAEELQRQEVLALLEQLGHEQDEEVLTAARAVSGKLADAGVSWDALLVPETSDEPEDDQDDDDQDDDDLSDDDLVDDPEEEAGGDEVRQEIVLTGDADEKTTETLRIIDELLGGSRNSEEFIEELEGYKSDIQSGEFDDSDHRYIRGLYKRIKS